MQKILTTIVISIVVICVSFGAGYLTREIKGNSGTGGSSASNSEQVSRIVELTRDQLITERAELSAERTAIERERNLVSKERAELDRQRELAKTDRGDFTELSSVLENIRVLAQDKE